MDDTALELQQSPHNSLPAAEEYRQAKVIILQQAPQQSFPDNYKLPAARKLVLSDTLVTLAPEMMDNGRLWHLEG